MRNPASIKTENIKPYGDVPVFPITQFFYHKEDKSFSQEASSLEIEIGNVYKVIIIHNEKTGGRRMYHLVKELGDREEVGGWEYVCLAQPELKLTIWND